MEDLTSSQLGLCMDSRPKTPTIVVISLIAAAILGTLAIVTAAWEIPPFFDPCHSFGIGESGSGTIGPDDDCQNRSGTSETKIGVLVRLLLIQGTGLVGAVFAFVGWRKGGHWFLASAVLFALLVLPLMLGGSGILLAVASGLSFAAARRAWPVRES